VGRVAPRRHVLSGVEGGGYIPDINIIFFYNKMLSRRVFFYNPKLKQLASNLRKNSTLSEVLLWNKLKRKQLLDYDFGRQKPVDNYIIDFFCPKLNLAVEIDGITHGEEVALRKDAERQKKLESLGIKFLRFTEGQIRRNLWAVLAEIENWIKKNENNNE
jgi:very-short-patch-repair endonuclease